MEEKGVVRAGERVPVFFDNDGGVDDQIALLMLLCHPERVELLGIAVLDADCHIEPAVSAIRKILDLVGRSEVVLGKSTLEGPNPFPPAWRSLASMTDNLPVLNSRPGEPAAQVSPKPGQQVLAETILSSARPVTLVMTGPLSNLAWALDHYPQVEAKITEVVWMGGAVDVKGNVGEPGHDGSAEWNAFWDPGAVKRVFDSALRLRIFSLDSTNHVPITADFVKLFGRNWQSALANFVGSSWGSCALVHMDPSDHYYAWDSLTAAFLAKPDICEFEEVRLVVDDSGPSQGSTRRDEAHGRPVLMARNVKAQQFYDLCLSTFR
eukprot:RCo033886